MSSGFVSKVEKLRDKILEEYKETAFRKELWPDPPRRGTYGMATIPLKEGAVPFTAKAFCMHGERAEAYKKVVQDWLNRDSSIEPTLPSPRSGWCRGLLSPRKMPSFLGEE